MILENNSADEILCLLSKKGYRSQEAMEVCREIEISKRTYDYLIKNQMNMPGRNKSAEAVVKYYLFLLDELKQAWPYDAMGCESTVPLLMLQEFQKETIVEDIVNFLGNPDKLDRKGLQQEIRRFIVVQLDPKGIVLYMDILKNRIGA